MKAVTFHAWAAAFAVSLAAGIYTHPGWLAITGACIAAGAWHMVRNT